MNLSKIILLAEKWFDKHLIQYFFFDKNNTILGLSTIVYGAETVYYLYIRRWICIWFLFEFVYN